jgi:hypothetical protein
MTKNPETARQKARRYRERHRDEPKTPVTFVDVLRASDRLWAQCQPAGECWVWTGHRSPKGYGVFGIRQRKFFAQRIAYQVSTLTPAIPGHLRVLHHCDNPPCINPMHLFLGTPKDNMDDMHRKGRHPVDRGDNSWRPRGADHWTARRHV